jgi:hypothetical protein
MYLRVAAPLFACWQIFGHRHLDMSSSARLCLPLVRGSKLGPTTCPIIHWNQALPVPTISYHGDSSSYNDHRHLTKFLSALVSHVLPPSRGSGYSAVDVCVPCTSIAMITRRAPFFISMPWHPIQERRNWQFTVSALSLHPSKAPTS